ncbi:hypothetical protein [[Micrococcus luteus] ATCC 49442]|nr:hypothetical protein [[Micrococcus luteus] ATCC 49442]
MPPRVGGDQLLSVGNVAAEAADRVDQLRDRVLPSDGVIKDR